LWRSDGATAGTFFVQENFAGAKAGSPASFTVLDGALYFSAFDISSGNELWRANGTAAGPVRGGQVVRGCGSSNPSNLAAAGGRLFLAATTEAEGEELWSFDPAAIRTVAFSTASQSGSEGSGTMTVTAQLSAVTDQPVTVPFTVSGTATN